MSRCGYVDDLDQQDLAMWRGRVMSSIRGKRGQKLLTDLRDALDAMPSKRLIANDLVNGDEVCSLGAVGKIRAINLKEFSPDDHDGLAQLFDVAPCLIQEVEFVNDESVYGVTSESRWTQMRAWADRHIQAKKGGKK